MQTKLSDQQTQKTSQTAQGREHYAGSLAHMPQSYSLIRDQTPLALSMVQLVLLSWLTWWVRRHPVASIDVKISRVLQKNQAPVLLRILAFAIAIVLWRVRLRLEAIMMVAITLTSALAKTILHYSINRPRPSPMLVKVQEHSSGKSFPSGHVIASLTFWGWLLVLVTLLGKGNSPWKKAFIGVSALFMSLVGPIRIYLGDHWASDVLGGYLFGGAWLGLFMQLYRQLKQRDVLSK
ncbi:MAG: hypothetical protein NVSMB33_14800 [Ktedonobacteraceae bacterium]